MTKSCTCHQTPTPSYSQIGKPKESSVIGEILALAARPEVISFAGGLPSAEGFPVKAIKDAADWVLETCPQVALQYSAVVCLDFGDGFEKCGHAAHGGVLRPTTACPRRPTKS